MNPIDKILPQLKKVKSRGHKHIACCPAHPDNNPSLAIEELSDGKVIMKCWSGCDVESIVMAIDLTMSDLFPKSNTPYRQDYSDQIETERLVLAMIKSDADNGKPFDRDRAELAMHRLKHMGAA